MQQGKPGSRLGGTEMQQGGRFQVGIVVQDLAPMVDFYEGLLGFEHIEDLEMPNGLMKRFFFGDSGLKLLALDEPRATSHCGHSGWSDGRDLWHSVPDDRGARRERFGREVCCHRKSGAHASLRVRARHA